MRIVLVLFLVGLYLIGSGGYGLYIQASASRQPTTVSITDLDKNVPANRHLIITGGKPVSTAAVKVYRKTRWGTTVSGSEILFIPVIDATAPDGTVPNVLLEVSEDQINAAKAGDKIKFRSIEGVRATSMELKSHDKARQRLVSTYGDAAVDHMIILIYHGTVSMTGPLAKLVGGVLLSGVMAVLFIASRKPNPQPPPIPAITPTQ